MILACRIKKIIRFVRRLAILAAEIVTLELKPKLFLSDVSVGAEGFHLADARWKPFAPTETSDRNNYGLSSNVTIAAAK